MLTQPVSYETLAYPYRGRVITAVPYYVHALHRIEMIVVKVDGVQRAPYISLALVPVDCHLLLRINLDLSEAQPSRRFFGREDLFHKLLWKR